MKPLLTLLTASFFTFVFVSSCKKDGSKSGIKTIDSLTLQIPDSLAFPSGEIVVTITSTDTILVSVPPFTNLSNLIAQITITGTSISPASGTKQDFSSPVTYTVTAQNGSQQKYTVIVSVRGVVYFGSGDDNFYALDAVLGNLLWKTTAGDFSYSDPTLVNGIIYAGNIDENMYALNATTGAVIWKYTTSSTIESAPTVANGIVYFGNDGYQFYALDANTGQLKWQFTAGHNISTKPVVLNGIVYFGSDDSYIYALNAASGSVVWKYQTGGLFNHSGPAIVNGILYIGDRNSDLYALDAATGYVEWTFYANGISLEQSSATVANGVVYIGGWYNILDFTQAGSLYAVDAATGALQWTALDGLGIGSDPTVANGLLYITCDDTYLYAVDVNSHAVVWRDPINAMGAAAAVSGGVVYCGGGGTRYFYSMDALTGATKWTFPVGDNEPTRTSTPVIAGSTTL